MIRKVSKSQSKRLYQYRKLRDKFLSENRECARCGGNSQDLHHMAGRIGSDLTDVTNFLAVCRPCHTWIETHPSEAKDKGYSKMRTKN